MVVHALYDRLNLRDRGRTWSREEFMLGFAGDIGNLAKLVMVAEGARSMLTGSDARVALEHELADCLWSVLVLAKLYNVDLERRLRKRLVNLPPAFARSWTGDPVVRVEASREDRAPLTLPGVTAVVLDETDRILPVRRSDSGEWTLVTGCLEPGEQPEAGVLREIEEETPIRAGSSAFLRSRRCR